MQSGENVWQTRHIDKAGIRSIFLADGPHGIRKQVGSGDHLGLNASVPATCFPTAATIANSWDTDLADRIGQALGSEANSLGVDVVLGPGLNIKRSPLGGRNFEYFSEDPYLSGKLAAGYVRGIQSKGVAACPKHFAVNSQETNRMISNSVIDQQTLRELYLTAFEIVVRQAAPFTIMSSYNLVNGTYANEHQQLLQSILRDEWGFDGVVVTDWGGSNDVVEAAKIGGGFEMPSPGFSSVPTLMKAVKEGRLPVEALDAHVEAMVQLIERLNPGSEDPSINVALHNDMALEAAQKSVVLLRNEEGILPLAQEATVAVIGDFANVPRYQGAGSSRVNPTMLASALDALPDSGLTSVGYAQGFHRDGHLDEALVDEAIRVSGRADVTLLYLGLDELSESEGVDRKSLALPSNQVRLLEALKQAGRKIIVVFSAGSAVEMPWLDKCDALVHGYLGGQAGAPAVLDVISGKVNPSGRLAESYLLQLADSSTAGAFPAPGKNAEYREGPFIGYRYASTREMPLLFPFGFGLSYSTFVYSDAQVTDSGVRVTVTNTGDRSGVETVQVYVGRSTSSPTGVLRPAWKLAGFAKQVLEPGESAQVDVAFDEYTFRHYDTETKSWQVEAGDFVVAIGPNLRDIVDAGVVTISADHPAGFLGGISVIDPRPQRLAGLPHYVDAQLGSVTNEEWELLLNNPDAVLDEDKSGPLHMNSPLSAMAHAKSPLARFVWRRMQAMMRKSEAKGQPDLNLLFLSSMPFRSIYNMSVGMADQQMVQSILTVVNGHFFRGVGSLISGFFRNRKQQKMMSRKFAAEAGNQPVGK